MNRKLFILGIVLLLIVAGNARLFNE